MPRTKYTTLHTRKLLRGIQHYTVGISEPKRKRVHHALRMCVFTSSFWLRSWLLHERWIMRSALFYKTSRSAMLPSSQQRKFRNAPTWRREREEMGSTVHSKCLLKTLNKCDTRICSSGWEKLELPYRSLYGLPPYLYVYIRDGVRGGWWMVQDGRAIPRDRDILIYEYRLGFSVPGTGKGLSCQ